jgi:fructose transport system substrate-binding protein
MSFKMKATLAFAGLAFASGAALAQKQPIIGLITKTETNPFFVKMKEGAQAEAKKMGAKLMTASGKKDGDTASQITAIETMTAAGVKTILITSTGDAIIPAVKKAQEKGVQVIALDSPFEGADALYATDNYKAGILIGEYAKAALGAAPAKIAMLDLFPGHPVGAQRHNGFMKGWMRSPMTCPKPLRPSAQATPMATRPKAKPPWKTACKRTPTSTWCTPSTNPLQPVPTTH